MQNPPPSPVHSIKKFKTSFLCVIFNYKPLSLLPLWQQAKSCHSHPGKTAPPKLSHQLALVLKKNSRIKEGERGPIYVELKHILLLKILVADDDPCITEGILQKALSTGHLKQGYALNPSFGPTCYLG